MPQQEPQPVPGVISRADAFDWVYRVLLGHSACLYVFTRKGFGVRAFEHAGPMAMLVMVVYMLFGPCLDMVYFFAAWMVAVIIHRVFTLGGRLRGVKRHSRYDGSPWLVRLILRPKPGEAFAKGLFEPLLALLVGGLMLPYSVPLGFFVMAGSVSLAIKGLIEHGIDAAQIQAMTDQEWEMRNRLARYQVRR